MKATDLLKHGGPLTCVCAVELRINLVKLILLGKVTTFCRRKNYSFPLCTSKINHVTFFVYLPTYLNVYNDVCPNSI
jgi:hypothetical protein